MKRVITIVMATLLTILGVNIAYAANPKFGEPCPKLNLKKNFEYITYICAEVNGKLVWTGESYVGGDPNQPVSEIQNSNLQAKSKKSKVKLILPKLPTPTLGAKCDNSVKTGFHLKDGVLYCVPISDGSYKYIENYTTPPSIKNPDSPEKLNACRPPDLRGVVPDGWDHGAITYPASNHILVNSGTMNIAVVPIDFSDVVGTKLPSADYAGDLTTMTKWFEFFSNGKLKIQYQFEDRWHRAPSISTHYDVGEGIDVSKEGLTTKQLMQEYIELTKSTYDYSKVDSILFVYPKEIKEIKKPVTRYSSIFINGQSRGVMLMATSAQNNTDGPIWLWTIHEMLHPMGLVMHFPVNPPDWGVEWGGYTHSEVLLPWNQSVLDWIDPSQYYCVSAENVLQQKITLVPLEKINSGIRAIFIRVTNSEVLMVVSHRKGEWSYNLPDNYYGTMVALIDTTKQTDRTGEASGDQQDGIKYSKSGIYLHPTNDVILAHQHIWDRNGAGEWGSLLYLGDSIIYKGIKIKMINANNFDTVEISKS